MDFEPPESTNKDTVRDSSRELQEGLETRELDTVPAELLDFFNVQ